MLNAVKMLCDVGQPISKTSARQLKILNLWLHEYNTLLEGEWDLEVFF